MLTTHAHWLDNAKHQASHTKQCEKTGQMKCMKN